MNLQNEGNRKFKLNVSGGHVLCGDNSRMNVTYRRVGHHAARIHTVTPRPSDAKITGPDQLISTIPFRVYTQLAALLARDKINIAGRLFNLTLEEAMSLRDNAEDGCLSMDGVFQLMRERHVNLGQLVQVLKQMLRFDALSVLTEAGYPDHPTLHPCVASEEGTEVEQNQTYMYRERTMENNGE